MEKYIVSANGLSIGDKVHIRTSINEYGEDGVSYRLPSTGKRLLWSASRRIYEYLLFSRLRIGNIGASCDLSGSEFFKG